MRELRAKLQVADHCARLALIPSVGIKNIAALKGAKPHGRDILRFEPCFHKLNDDRSFDIHERFALFAICFNISAGKLGGESIGYALIDLKAVFADARAKRSDDILCIP